jgi:hypothetical protein
MKRELKELALKSGVGMLSDSQIETFTNLIVARCIEHVEKFDSNYAVKMIKKEFNIEDKK